jgi:hypothetical protein
MNPVFVVVTNTYGLVIAQGQGANVQTERKIRSFAQLPQGWHYGAGGPIAGEIIHIACQYLWHLMMLGFVETDAFPGVDGEVMVTAYRGKHCIELTVELDRSFAVAHQFDGEDRFHEVGLSGVQACAALEHIAREVEQEQCAIFGWSTSNSMTGALDALRILPLRAQVTAAAPPSFANDVARIPAEQSANISSNFTGALVVNLQFFGHSTTHSSIQAVG